MQGANTIPADMPIQSYNRLQIPYNYDPITEMHPVYIELELSDLVNLDTQDGVIYVTAYMTLLWKDYRFQWDMKYANVSSSFVDMNFIWIPDITLYNQAGDSKIMDAPAQIYHDGSVRLRRIAFLSAYCGVNIKSFPFDTQLCTLDFASWAGHLAVTAAPKQLRLTRNNLISPQAVYSISYNLDSFTADNTLKDEGGIQKNWPFVVYTLKVTRHSRFYISTTIFPIIIVTVICVFGLWNPTSTRD